MGIWSSITLGPFSVADEQIVDLLEPEAEVTEREQAMQALKFGSRGAGPVRKATICGTFFAQAR
jgi:hypothetical protein